MGLDPGSVPVSSGASQQSRLKPATSGRVLITTVVLWKRIVLRAGMIKHLAYVVPRHFRTTLGNEPYITSALGTSPS